MAKADGQKNPTQRDLVRAALSALRAGTGPRPDLADAVESFFEIDVEEQRRKPTLSLYMSKATWSRAKAKADAEGRTRSDVIEEGYGEILAGRFVPTKPARAAWNSGATDTTTTTSVRLHKPDLVAEVAAYAVAHAEVWGWEPSPPQMAAVWLERYAPADGAPNGK